MRAHGAPHCGRWMYSHQGLLPKRTAATRPQRGYNASLPGTKPRQADASSPEEEELWPCWPEVGANRIGGVRSQR